MTFKGRIEALERSLKEFEAKSKRVPLNVLVVNDPEAGLEEYRLPAEVLEKLGTIKIGRPEPGAEVESAREWVARLTEAARRAARAAWTPGNMSIRCAGDVTDRNLASLSAAWRFPFLAGRFNSPSGDSCATASPPRYSRIKRG